MDWAIRLHNVSKRYRVGGSSTFGSLGDRLGSLFSGARQADAFNAVAGVDLVVEAGTVLGIVGENGAGKSTLLKLMSRISYPTTGRIEVRGRVGSLLEVGSGFHPELSGRENIYLNGALLGMRRAEVKERLDDIVDFSGVSRFLDSAVKHYSSGMHMRLAFSVAAHLNTEILLVDEVLAVGDAAFQRRCLERMDDLTRKEGRTVVFVSHNLAAVESLCSRAIHMSAGSIGHDGTPSEVVQQYLRSLEGKAQLNLRERKDRHGDGRVHFVSVRLTDADDKPIGSGQTGASVQLVVDFENTTNEVLQNVDLSIGIDDAMGRRVTALGTELVGSTADAIAPGRHSWTFRIDALPLMPGRYRLTLFATALSEVVDWVRDATILDVEGGDFFGTGRLPPSSHAEFLVAHRISLS